MSLIIIIIIIICTPNFLSMCPLFADENLTPKGAWLRSGDQFPNFGTLFIPSEWLKAETSYSALAWCRIVQT